MGQWVFEELRGAAVRRGPQEALLFKTEQAGEGEYAGNDHLVREVLQNALDARQDSAPIRVRFAIHEATEAPSPERLKYYFERLRAPLAGRLTYGNSGIPEMPCRFLVCEDFGTRGLEGNTLLFSDPPSAFPKEDFYWFWRNIGRSGKTGMDLGRWGLGKTVFRAVSRSGCMFGLTIRHSDRARLLMGQAVLQIHRHGGNEYQPEGYWCGEQDANTGLPLPVVHHGELDQFCQEWRLTRAHESGTSVVSPYIPDELRSERLVQAVAVHFFTRILRGEMEVEVSGKDLGQKVLNQSTIESVCRQIKWDGSKRAKRHTSPPIGFVKRCLHTPPTISTEVLGKSKIPSSLSESGVAAEPLAAMRHAFAAGDLVGLRVQIHLPRRNDGDLDGRLDVFAERLQDGEKCDAYFVREGMTITKINSRAANRGIQAFVIVDPGPLAALLGDTEGPAHEDWDTSEERPDREWKTWKGRVNFVRKIVDHFVELLTPPTSEPDFDLLSDFFSLEQIEGPQRSRAQGNLKKSKPTFDPPPVVPKWFQITERAGGFTVSRTPHVPMPLDPALIVSVAYDLPKGDPLKKWCPLDFEIGQGERRLTPGGSGAKWKPLRGNRLILSRIQDSFSLTLDGFDRNRDLYVRVEEATLTDEVNP